MPDCTVAHTRATHHPNPHTSQPDPHMARGHILIVSLSRTSVYFGRVQKNNFLVQNMRHELLPSSRHRSRTMLSKAKHLTPTPSNAARRCAQRDRQFVWQRRPHSQADDPLGAAFFFAPFLTFQATLNLTPATTLLQFRSLLWLFWEKLDLIRSPRFFDCRLAWVWLACCSNFYSW